MAAGGRVGNERRRNWNVGSHCALAKRGGASGGAGANTAHLPGESLVLCGGAKTGRPSSDGPALCGAGDGLWPANRPPTEAASISTTGLCEFPHLAEISCI